MRVVIQRVRRANVVVDGGSCGSIGPGLLLLVGFERGDGELEIEWMARKVLGLRVFPDADGRMNRDVREAGGELLVVSQFTLYGDCEKGRRPSFVHAAPAEEAEPLYRKFVDTCRRSAVPVAEGSFGASMQVELVNDGPVTLLIER